MAESAKDEAEADAKPASDDHEESDEATTVKPQVLLLPGGQMTPFTLDLKAPNYPVSMRIEGDLLGRIKRERRTVEKAAAR